MRHQTKIKKTPEILNRILTYISFPIILLLIVVVWLAELVVDCGERFQGIIRRTISVNHPEKNEAYKMMYKYDGLAKVLVYGSFLGGSILIISMFAVNSNIGIFIAVGLTLIGFVFSGFFVYKRDKIHKLFSDLPNLSASEFF